MKKYRIVIWSGEIADLFLMKDNATDSSDVNSWKYIATYSSISQCFIINSKDFKPSDFCIAGDHFNPITLQNF